MSISRSLQSMTPGGSAVHLMRPFWLKTLSQTAESNCWTAFMEIKHVRLPGIDKSLPPCVTYDAAAVSDQYMPPYTIQHLQPLMLSTWSRLVTIWVKTKDHPAIRATARGRKSHIKSMSSLETPSHRLTLWKKKKLCSSHLGTALVFGNSSLSTRYFNSEFWTSLFSQKG